MPWREPAYPGEFPSLGWEVLDWVAEYLELPDGPNAGEPFELTDEQSEIVVRWYALDPKTGRRKYRRGALRRSKGWGKDPLLAALACAEFAGPVRFDGWDAAGDPVGVRFPTPWVQVAGVSEEASDANTYSLIHAMLAESPLVGELGLDVGLTRINYAEKPSAKIEPVSASAGAREGQRVTFSTKGETQYWLPSNGGRKLSAVLDRNAAKMDGTTFASTNAHMPGEQSVAEADYEAANRRTPGLFYDAVEAPELSDEEIRSGGKKLKEALKIAYGDAKWVNVDRLALECADPAVDLADARRFYLNQVVAGERRAVEPAQWASLVSSRSVQPNERVALGFDGSISRDATALVGCTSDGFLFELGLWENPGVKGWQVPRREVHEAVAAAFDRFDVVAMFVDPHKWRQEMVDWQHTFGDELVIEFDTITSRFPKAVDRFLTAVREASLSHDGAVGLTKHVVACDLKKVRTNDPDDDARTLYRLVKNEHGDRIDAAVAAVLALEANASVEPSPEVMFFA